MWRIIRQRFGDLYPLLHAARERIRRLVHACRRQSVRCKSPRARCRMSAKLGVTGRQQAFRMFPRRAFKTQPHMRMLIDDANTMGVQPATLGIAEIKQPIRALNDECTACGWRVIKAQTA